jgi:hypothetical protein
MASRRARTRRSRPSRRASSSISVNGQKITSLGAPTSANDAVTKTYVDALLQGLAAKAPVRLATTAALPANTYSNGASGVGATITINATGTLTIDGTLTALNDRVLVQNEATSANNGPYVVTTAGAIGVQAVLTRATDMNTAAQFAGAYVLVEQGTTNKNRGFMLPIDPDVAFVVGTTAQTWFQFTGVGDLTAGSGITFTGNTVSVSTTLDLNYTMGASGTALTVTNNITSGSFTCSSISSAGGAALALSAASSGINLQLAGVTKADLGTTSATALTLAAGISYSGAAGTGALSFGSMTGDTTLTTGALTYAGASGKAAALGTTAANFSVTTTTSGTISLSSAGAFTIAGAAASSITSTSGGVTVDATGNTVNIGTTNATGVTISRSGQQTTIQSRADLQQQINFVGIVSPSAVSGTINDWNGGGSAGNATNIRVSLSGPLTLTGLNISQHSGTRIAIHNIDATNTITISALTGSSAANQFAVATTIGPGSSKEFWYDLGSTKFRLYGT